MSVSYRTKIKPIGGTSYGEVMPAARELMRQIAKRTKRRPYIRSAYFRREKVFLTFFWPHLLQLPRYQRTRRLKYLPCAVDLIRHSKQEPEFYQKRDRPSETFYRFSGITADGIEFAAQIKQSKQGRKELMSVFPYK